LSKQVVTKPESIPTNNKNAYAKLQALYNSHNMPLPKPPSQPAEEYDFPPGLGFYTVINDDGD